MCRDLNGSIDLMLLHQPGPSATRAETWRALEEFLAEGKLRSIGVSNFGVDHLEKLSNTARVTPAVNQVRSFLVTSCTNARQDGCTPTSMSHAGGVDALASATSIGGLLQVSQRGVRGMTHLMEFYLITFGSGFTTKAKFDPATTLRAAGVSCQ